MARSALGPASALAGSACVAVAVASLAEIDARRRLGFLTAAPAGLDRARDAPLV
jgi:hypothetical protein